MKQCYTTKSITLRSMRRLSAMKQKIDAAVLALEEDVTCTLQKWIRIPSEKKPPEENAPFGAPLREMLTVALSDAKRLDMRVRDFDGYIGDVEIGDGEETMGILAHLDVVPAGDGWQHEPFGAAIIDGRLYGRGASDDKGPAVAALFAMKAIMNAGLMLKKKVRLILGCDEESGWDDIRYYKERVEMPDFGFSPDAEFPIINTEKGIEQIKLFARLSGEAEAAVPVYEVLSGERANVVPGLATAEIGYDDLAALTAKIQETGFAITAERMDNGHVKLISTGNAAHASMPQLGRNAAGQLLLLLKAIGAGGGSHAFIACLADGIGLDYTGKGFGIDGSDTISGALTLNLGVLHITQESAKAIIDIRHPVLMNSDMIAKIIQMRVKEAGIKVEIAQAKAPLHVPAEAFIVRELLDVYHEVTGNEPYTIAIGGGTYSRSMDNCVAFGSNFPGDPEVAHQADEYIRLDSLMQNVRIFAHAIARLAC